MATEKEQGIDNSEQLDQRAREQGDMAAAELPAEAVRALPSASEMMRWLALIAGWPPTTESVEETGDPQDRRDDGRPAPIDAGSLDIVPLVEQLSRFIGTVCESPEMSYCEFTLEFVQLGSIEGNVLIDGGQAQVMLAPRRGEVAALLREQKREIELRAGRQAGIAIRLSIRSGT